LRFNDVIHKFILVNILLIFLIQYWVNLYILLAIKIFSFVAMNVNF